MALYRALLPLFIYVCRSALGQSVVEVEVGAPSVTLPGKTTRSLVNDPTVRWTWRSESNEVHLRDEQDDDLRNQNPLFTNRTQMNPDALESGNVSLELKNPTLNDFGTYTCVVREVSKEVDRFTVELMFKGLKVDVTEGSSSVSLPFPPMRTLESEVSVKWTFGSQEVHLRRGGADDFSAQSGQFKGRTQMKPNALKCGDLSLELKDLTLRDNGPYTCVVTEGSTELARITVNLYVEPLPVPVIVILLLLLPLIVLLIVVLFLTDKRKKQTHEFDSKPVIITIIIELLLLLLIALLISVVFLMKNQTHDPALVSLIITIIVLLLLLVLLLVVLFLTHKRKKETHESWREAFIRMITCRPHPSTSEIIEKLHDKEKELRDKIEELSAREKELSDQEEKLRVEEEKLRVKKELFRVKKELGVREEELRAIEEERPFSLDSDSEKP